MYYRDDREKSRERGCVCVIVYGRHALQPRKPPGDDAQVNGDSAHATGLPDCSLGKGRTHWVDLILGGNKGFLQRPSQGTRTSWNCLDFEPLKQNQTKICRQQMTKAQRRLASWGFFGYIHLSTRIAGLWRFAFQAQYTTVTAYYVVTGQQCRAMRAL